ncbi:serpin B6-like [Paramacrobiotus metropolitanus]|uniref:serpin B6-like n=1 Tax=Paramacrobiotus metropolitanus TaxID=2943436 RepID=UPI002445CDC4|nr:serpin B6-like [Paramacrobiotus metropolitanus]
MEKLSKVFRSCAGSQPGNSTKRRRRTPRPYTKDFKVNPESSFAVTMFKAVIESAKAPDANIIISPYSAEVVLAALLPGISGELKPALMELLCKNKRQFPELIRKLDAVNTDGELNAVNAAFYDDNCSLAPQYTKAIDSAMKFGFVKTPFAKSPGEAVTMVNQFVAEKTNGKITKLLEKVDRRTLLILVNVIDFSGQWECPFDKEETKNGTFYCPNNYEKTVDFMKNEDATVRAYNIHGYKAAEKNVEVGDPHMIILNVVERKFSVMFLLPAKDAGGINSLEKELPIEKLLKLRQKSSEEMICIVVPKFRISCGLDLIPGAKAMGLEEMFEPSVTNFEQMFENDSRPKRVDQFRQEVVIEVDEYGIKASAATCCSLGYNCIKYPDFQVDHPFLVIIWNEIANVPVFIGRITEPDETADYNNVPLQ